MFPWLGNSRVRTGLPTFLASIPATMQVGGYYGKACVLVSVLSPPSDQQ